MSFEKKEWKYRDTITAEELNRLEDGVEEALDKGYSCTETATLLTDESVTTAQPEDAPEGIYGGTLAYSTLIDVDTIKVTFNGTEYVCDAILTEDTVEYGDDDDDFSEYPFTIYSSRSDEGNSIYTETAGTYQVKIEALVENVQTSECFEKAVMTSSLAVGPRTTWQEINDALLAGKRVYYARWEGKNVCAPVLFANKDDGSNSYNIKVLSPTGNSPTYSLGTASAPTEPPLFLT